MSNEMFTQLPTTTAAQLSDIVCAVQGYSSPSSPGTSVQETLGQIFNLFLANTVLNNAGNPNGSVAGVTYQLCLDTTNSILYVCTTSGNAATAVWKVAGNFSVPALANEILYTSAPGVVSGTASVNNAVLVTSNSGVPSLSTTLPNAVQLNITELGTQAQALNMGGFQINNGATPTLPSDYATKQYVDTTALNGTSVYAASAGSLGTVTQSGAGVGATLTNAGAQATLLLDGVTPPVGTNELIKNTATVMTIANEGIYTVTSVGSPSTNWILTRATSYDSAVEINNTGLILVQNGSTLVGTAWYNAATIVTVDTTAFSFSEFGNIVFPISLANGGTNNSLTASNGGIVWSDASKLNILSGTATAGLALLSGSSSTPSWSNLPPITKVNIQTFTSTGTSTYTITAGTKFAVVEVLGPGGGGGGTTGGASSASAGGGGGSGGYGKKVYTIAQLGTGGTVVVGTGGTAGTSGGGNGVTGGTSSFAPATSGATLTCGGGGGGTGDAGTPITTGGGNFGGGGGGSSTNGDINIIGNNGGTGIVTGARLGGAINTGLAGVGANSIYGGGGASGTGNGPGNTFPPSGFGSGGAGSTSSSASEAGAAGTNGIVIITEYIST